MDAKKVDVVFVVTQVPIVVFLPILTGWLPSVVLFGICYFSGCSWSICWHVSLIGGWCLGVMIICIDPDDTIASKRLDERIKRQRKSLAGRLRMALWHMYALIELGLEYTGWVRDPLAPTWVLVVEKTECERECYEPK